MEKTTRDRMVAELTELLTQGNAHVTLDEACAAVPPTLLNQPVAGLPYTLWQLAEHVRIAQWDIVEFCLNPEHESPPWPAGYWPAPEQQATAAHWQHTLAQIAHDRNRFLDLLRDPQQDLVVPLPHGNGQTLLREALLLGDHAAYHTGQIILVRRLLGNWD